MKKLAVGRRLLLLSVAEFVASTDLTLTDIAAALHISTSLASKLHAEAIAEGLVERCHRFLRHRLTQRERAELQAFMEGNNVANQLHELFKTQLGAMCRVSVIQSASAGHKAMIDYHNLGKLAAPAIARLVQEIGPSVGVASWGAALRGIADGLAEFLEMEGIKFSPITWVAARGDVVGLGNRFSANAIIASLSELADSKDERDESLEQSIGHVPAVLPYDFTGNRARVLREYFEHLPDYSRWYSGERKVRQAKLVLLSCGPWPPTSPITCSLFSAGGLDVDAAILGDVAGIPIHPHGTKTFNGRASAQRFEERLLGLSREDLQDIRTRGGRIVLVAFHSINRVPVVLEAIRLGWVSDLLVDTVLAGHIFAACSKGTLG